jgi:hypothetical protein
MSASPASKGWAVIAAWVFVFDTWVLWRDRETLSQAFLRASRKYPVLISVGWGVLTGHLFGLFGRWDPFRKL